MTNQSKESIYHYVAYAYIERDDNGYYHVDCNSQNEGRKLVGWGYYHNDIHRYVYEQINLDIQYEKDKYRGGTPRQMLRVINTMMHLYNGSYINGVKVRLYSFMPYPTMTKKHARDICVDIPENVLDHLRETCCC